MPAGKASSGGGAASVAAASVRRSGPEWSTRRRTTSSRDKAARSGNAPNHEESNRAGAVGSRGQAQGRIAGDEKARDRPLPSRASRPRPGSPAARRDPLAGRCPRLGRVRSPLPNPASQRRTAGAEGRHQVVHAATDVGTFAAEQVTREAVEDLGPHRSPPGQATQSRFLRRWQGRRKVRPGDARASSRSPVSTCSSSSSTGPNRTRSPGRRACTHRAVSVDGHPIFAPEVFHHRVDAVEVDRCMATGNSGHCEHEVAVR